MVDVQVLQNPVLWLGAYGAMFFSLGIAISVMRVHMMAVAKVNILDVLKDKKSLFARIHRGHGNNSEWIGVIFGVCLYHLYASGGKCDATTERAMSLMVAGKIMHTAGMIIPTKGIIAFHWAKFIGVPCFYFSGLFLAVKMVLAALAA